MDDDVISRYDAKGQMRRLKAKSAQWRKNPYRDGWNDAIESADQALNNCRPLDVKTVVLCRNCLKAEDRNTTLPFCTVQKRRKQPDDYCNEGLYQD